MSAVVLYLYKVTAGHVELKNRCAHLVQWPELKFILIALAKVPLHELCYIFTDS